MRIAWRRAVIAIIGTALVAAALAYAFWPRPLPVDLAQARQGPLQVTVGGDGMTRVKEVYVVSAPLAGRVLRIESHAGDAVVGGETIVATIRPAEPEFLDVRSAAEAEARVRAAEAAKTLADARLAKYEAELEFAESDLKRARALSATRNISQRALERAELAVRIAEAEVATAVSAAREADFELKLARATLMQPGQGNDPESDACCIEVRAPVSGRVLRLIRESESVVAVGTPLLEIGDPRDLEIVVDLLSADAVKVAARAQAIIEHWGGDDVLAGRVRLVEPSGFTKVSALGIEEQRVNVIIDLVDPPEKWGALAHGYRVEVRVVVWSSEDILKVPVSALFREGDRWAVFVVKDGRAHLRPVALGRRNDLEAAVVDGLDEGETVVRHPSDKLTDGGRVASREDVGI
jgi:HlyD family secretion protein